MISSAANSMPQSRPPLLSASASGEPIIPGLDGLQIAATQTFPPYSTLLAFLRRHLVGLLTNQTGRTREGVSTLETLQNSGIRVQALFAPEHGPSGILEGEIESGVSADGTPIYSLYGKTRRPTPEMLAGLEIVVCDLQDVGARFYTYASTIAHVLEACAEHGIAVVILDRPNPLGDSVEGPEVQEANRSFVGCLRVPVCHGMTLGELAQLHRGDQQLNVDLQITPVINWCRSMRWPQTALPWRLPSPNLPNYLSAAWYPGACLLEFSGVSVGRGTASPFQIIGAPWMQPELVLETMHSWPDFLRETISAVPIEFTPTRATWENELCHGIRLHSNSAHNEPAQPVALGMALLSTLYHVHHQEFNDEELNRSLKLLGSSSALEAIRRGDLEGALSIARDDAEKFRIRRQPFLIYEE